MARDLLTPEMLDAFADDLTSGAEALKALAKLMREKEMPSALIHVATMQNHHVPESLAWIEKTSADVRTQLRAHTAGVPSTTAKRLEYAANQKLAAARKKKKAT